MNHANKIDVLSKLTPEMREVLRIQQEQSGEDAFSTDATLQEIRDNYTAERKFWNEDGPAMANTVEVLVPYAECDIPTRIYYPNEEAASSCLLYIHGGGMVVGNLDTHDRIQRMLASFSDSAVIAIDYSLSPEAKHPKALLECVAVVKHFRENADAYKLNPNSIGLAGDSGGAALSFSTALYLRDHEEDVSWIRALLLYYGMYGLTDSRSIKLYGGPWDGLTEDDLKYYGAMYLEKEEDRFDKYYNAYENDLTWGIPPTLIVACEFDPLIDDSLALYAILKDKGIDCTYSEYKGVIHAFLHYSRIMKDAERALQEGGTYFAELK